MSRLVATVYVKNPETFQWVTCEAGSQPPPHLAALILTPSAWEGGRAPEPEVHHEPPAAPEPAPVPVEPALAEATGAPEAPDTKPRTRRATPKAED
ncbi:hypothetical protein ACODT3_42405 [Streptomyces sp. 4.24]|uniref:hypothetical protein n=1 Tax=Streptomyces tritrimontium TaxID=3406573 RepID=UPI003BB5FBD4